MVSLAVTLIAPMQQVEISEGGWICNHEECYLNGGMDILDDNDGSDTELSVTDEAAIGEDESDVRVDEPEVAVQCYGRYCYTEADTLAALNMYAGPRTWCVIRIEVGMPGGMPATSGHEAWPQWSPNMYNPLSGVIGPGQLCCDARYHYRGIQLRGQLPEFIASRPDADPWNPYQVIPFVAHKISIGQGNSWHGIASGKC